MIWADPFHGSAVKMIFNSKPFIGLAESAAISFLGRHVPYRRLTSRRGIERELQQLNEVISICHGFVPHTDKIMVEPLDKFYAYRLAVSFLDTRLIQFLMLKSQTNQTPLTTITAWLVLLSGKTKFHRAFRQCLERSTSTQINKEAIKLVVDDGQGRRARVNQDIYKKIDTIRDAMTIANHSAPRVKVILTCSRRGKRIAAAMANDREHLKSIYERDGARAASDWMQTRPWFWFYRDPSSVQNGLKRYHSIAEDASSQWYWSYWH